MLLLVLKIIDLLEALLDYFVYVSVDVTAPSIASDYQWEVDAISIPTPKGWAVLDSVATIIHNGLDFVAQFTALLPLAAGNTNNAMSIVRQSVWM